MLILVSTICYLSQSIVLVGLDRLVCPDNIFQTLGTSSHLYQQTDTFLPDKQMDQLKIELFARVQHIFHVQKKK